jgi:ACR3 family arsenite efflux pump ArsB
VLLFAFQGEAILKQPLVIALLAVPILIQVFFNSGLAYWLNRAVGEKHNVACPSALIGASNFFELAVAAAISLFGFNSGAALATVVGVLIEVPVMLLVVLHRQPQQGLVRALFQMGFAGFCLVPSIACVLGLKDGAGVACSAS